MNEISKSETIWVTIKTDKDEVYYITSKEIRDYYYLYKRENDRIVKINKAKSPLELERFIVK